MRNKGEVPLIVTRDIINELRLNGLHKEADDLLTAWRSNNKENKKQMIKEERRKMLKIRDIINPEIKKAEAKKRKAYSVAYNIANKEKRKAYSVAYNIANKEKRKAYKKDYYEANKEKMLANNKAYYEANKEKIRAYKKAYDKYHYEKNTQYEKFKKMFNGGGNRAE